MKDNIILFEEKKFEIHKHIWLSITWILKRLNSKQTLSDDIREIKLSNWSLLSKTYQKSLLVTRTLIFLNKFMFYLNNRLVPLRILSYREPTVAAPISSWAIYKFFFFSWLAIQIRFWNLLTVLTVRPLTQNNQWSLFTVEQKATTFLPPWSKF